MNPPTISTPPVALSTGLVLRIVEAFDAASKDALHQVRTLHRLKAAGKRGVEIPDELRVVVTISLTEDTNPNTLIHNA